MDYTDQLNAIISAEQEILTALGYNLQIIQLLQAILAMLIVFMIILLCNFAYKLFNMFFG